VQPQIGFNSIIHTVKRLLLLNGVFLAVMSLFRLVFFLYYGDVHALVRTPATVGQAFFLGIRFDLVVVAYINSLVVLSLLIVWAIGKRMLLNGWLRGLVWYYTLMFSAVFLLLCVDFGFYSYFKNHLNILIFGIFEDDTAALFSTLAENYNLPLTVLGFGTVIVAVYILSRSAVAALRRDLPETVVRARPAAVIGCSLMLIAGTALAARGSFGLFPLGTMDAEISADLFLNKLSMNGLFTLQEALEYRAKENRDYDLVKALGYADNPAQAFADFLDIPVAGVPADPVSLLYRITPKNPAIERVRPNVVVIMMEGFGSDLMRYQSPQFNVLGALERHFATGYLFPHMLSGDVGTIGSLETVLLNLPKRPLAKNISQSKYAYGTFDSGAAVPYRAAGYETIFLYGGNVGWRNMYAFAPKLGFDVVEGEGSMDRAYLRNQWGVFDEFLFDAIYRKLAADDGRPRFVFALTTSNHPPYSLPPSYQPLPLTPPPALDRRITGDRALAQGRFETYQYANQKLGEFITRVAASPLEKRTIIAVTGDHNFWSVFDYTQGEMLEVNGVPFYIRVPEALKPRSADCAVFGSHADIMPTLYALSLSGQKYLALGSDLLDPAQHHLAYNVDGIILDAARGVRHSIDNGATACFLRDTAAGGAYVTAPRQQGHDRMIRDYRAAMAVTDYLVRHTPRTTH
jgi:phosphoglycerol transferase MdoB-like AlkP superfamily enzyme